MQLDRKHDHRSLEAWCQARFDEIQKENEELHSRIAETQKTTEKAMGEHKVSIDTTAANITQMHANIALLVQGMADMQARLPSTNSTKRSAEGPAEGDPGAAGAGTFGIHINHSAAAAVGGQGGGR